MQKSTGIIEQAWGTPNVIGINELTIANISMRHNLSTDVPNKVYRVFCDLSSYF